MIYAFFCEDGGDKTEFCGALFLYEADNPEDARAIMDNDPFYQNGIWHSVKMVAFPPGGGRLLGERPWKLSENSMEDVSLKYDSSVARWKPE